MATKRNFEIFSDNSVPDINKKDIESFSKGLDKQEESLTWSNLDPKSKPIYGVNLRLNEYELSLLRYIADREDRSQQKVLKRLLVPILEKEVQKLADQRQL